MKLDSTWNDLQEKICETEKGNIHYWMKIVEEDGLTLLFLPGLTANHRLFEKQIDYFKKDYNIFVWDAPGHGASRPFELTFSMEEAAEYLHEIIRQEEIQHPVLCGQSMGGYIGQCYMQRYPGELTGFISIDSPPLQRKYMTKPEIWMLKHTEPMFNLYSWNALLKAGAKGCAQTAYGIKLMQKMMEEYTKEEYVKLTGFGYRIVAEAVEKDLPYAIDCPFLLHCGERDAAGSTKRYIKNQSKIDHVPVNWIPNAVYHARYNCKSVNSHLPEYYLH